MKKVILVLAVMTVSTQAFAKDKVDLSQALAASNQEKQEVERQNKENRREHGGRRIASTTKEKIVVDLSNLEK